MKEYSYPFTCSIYDSDHKMDHVFTNILCPIKRLPMSPWAPIAPQILKKTKMDLFKRWAFMLAIFAPLHDYNVLISSFPCFPPCFFSANASFHTASKFCLKTSLRENTFSRNHELQRFYVRPQGPSNIWTDQGLVWEMSAWERGLSESRICFEVTRIVIFGK